MRPRQVAACGIALTGGAWARLRQLYVGCCKLYVAQRWNDHACGKVTCQRVVRAG